MVLISTFCLYVQTCCFRLFLAIPVARESIWILITWSEVWLSVLPLGDVLSIPNYKCPSSLCLEGSVILPGWSSSFSGSSLFSLGFGFMSKWLCVEQPGVCGDSESVRSRVIISMIYSRGAKQLENIVYC